ncbi:hypothetical protein [Alkalimarinus alittae]|uniref:Uncharacterized protein n=1 Tax=Alkalimarinus alittae TaxID=2961619 RepID=A0ABY6N1H4_9ALTE|nr:hypothetical protein [Alkalimarinus alittae]UZE95966.1 hypothetical protein NKI27_18265 [Alkalimarinus alittae]
MADLSGASLSIARPIVNNNGVNLQREQENQQTNQQIRTASVPQQDRPLNQQSTDIPPESSISSRLDTAVSANENNTQENTTVTREQVVLAVEQQLQQSNVNASATRSADEGATNIEQNRAESTANQTSNQTTEQLTSNNTQPIQTQPVNSNTADEPVIQNEPVPVASAAQNDDVERSVRAQDINNANSSKNDPITNNTTQVDNETQSARNPETGLGLESGSIIDTIV